MKEGRGVISLVMTIEVISRRGGSTSLSIKGEGVGVLKCAICFKQSSSSRNRLFIIFKYENF